MYTYIFYEYTVVVVLFTAIACAHIHTSQVRDICGTPAFQDGLVQGNLKIAEDRILSLLLVLLDKTGTDGSPTRTWETHWVVRLFVYMCECVGDALGSELVCIYVCMHGRRTGQ